tara:strand:- start:28 stop:255 length:228 start_codon:yes stop_codon:yes gene_type:complete
MEYKMINEIERLCTEQHKTSVNKDIKVMEDTLFHLRNYRIHFGICSNVFKDTGDLIDKIEKNLSVCKKYVRSIDD